MFFIIIFYFRVLVFMFVPYFVYSLFFIVFFCIVSPFVYSCLFVIFVQVYRTLPPGGNPIAIKKSYQHLRFLLHAG